MVSQAKAILETIKFVFLLFRLISKICCKWNSFKAFFKATIVLRQQPKYNADFKFIFHQFYRWAFNFEFRLEPFYKRKNRVGTLFGIIQRLSKGLKLTGGSKLWNDFSQKLHFLRFQLRDVAERTKGRLFPGLDRLNLLLNSYFVSHLAFSTYFKTCWKAESK